MKIDSIEVHMAMIANGILLISKYKKSSLQDVKTHLPPNHVFGEGGKHNQMHVHFTCSFIIYIYKEHIRKNTSM